MNTLVRIKFGSHLYGTNTETSDLDYKSVHIPDAKDILLQRAAGSLNTNTAQKKSEGEKNTANDVDNESYSLQKFLELAGEGQTVAIDMLFAPTDKLELCSPFWNYICLNRDKLLSKRSTAFVGYCRQQANKYGIKGSRVAAARKAASFFEVSMKALGGQAKVSDVSMYLVNILDEHTKLIDLPVSRGSENTVPFLECCNRKVGFTTTLKHAHEMFARVFDEYGKRALQAESNEGVDWKALSHSVRVANQAIELLSTGKVTFPLPNASHILDIKKGRLDYKIVSTEIERLLEEVEEAEAISILPKRPDKAFIENTILAAYTDAILGKATEMYDAERWKS